ncbi:MAG: beta-Ala-His dipeptidase [Erysipelotrichaceae bacterium]|nr:beta-Ala-His dipeptidase [Erysipelotrichaceae bacterium]
MEFDLNKPWCHYFHAISMIPRGSCNEKAVSDYVVNFAKERGLAWQQDEVSNVIIEKPATPGYEDAPVMVLQAHLDMVPAKEKDSAHDWSKDPLDLYVEDGLLKARGTTLGADDGTGVAYMLALLDSSDIPHPALQCFFTTMEEIGLVGALKLRPGCVKGTRMINLDGGGINHCGLSCAGGANGILTKELSWTLNEAPTYKAVVRGLEGGHSAGAISKEKANATMTLARILKETELKGCDIGLVSINGGEVDNAIPREAEACFVSSAPQEELFAAMEESEKAIWAELEFSDAGFELVKEPVKKAALKIDPKQSQEILDLLFVLPNGFQHKSMAIEGLTTVSQNLGITKTTQKKLTLNSLMRSAFESANDHNIARLATLAKAYGFDFEVGMRYPGWAYQAESELREIYANVVREKLGEELVTSAGHGGNECGVFAALKPGIDIVTFGPISRYIHTPQEELDLESFDKAWEVLTAILEASK